MRLEFSIKGKLPFYYTIAEFSYSKNILNVTTNYTNHEFDAHKNSCYVFALANMFCDKRFFDLKTEQNTGVFHENKLLQDYLMIEELEGRDHKKLFIETYLACNFSTATMSFLPNNVVEDIFKNIMSQEITDGSQALEPDVYMPMLVSMTRMTKDLYTMHRVLVIYNNGSFYLFDSNLGFVLQFDYINIIRFLCSMYGKFNNISLFTDEEKNEIWLPQEESITHIATLIR